MRWHDVLPLWRCGELGCPKRQTWQQVSAVGEYDDVDAATADLEAHYRQAHPEEVDADGRLCAA